MSPEQFTTLKQKIETSTILSAAENKEWLYLLPRMNDEQAKELDRILSVKIPATPTIYPPHEGEIKRGSGPTHPLPPMRHAAALAIKYMDIPVSRAEKVHRGATRSSPLPNPPHQGEGIKKEFLPPRGGGEVGGNSFSSLTLADLQAALSVFTFLEGLNTQVQNQLAARTATVEQIVADFEKSPLHKAYVQTGVALMAGTAGKLTREQFEAIADFSANLKKL